MTVAARVRITDLIDADASSPRYCGHSIGRVLAVQRDGQTLHVKILRVERSRQDVWGVGTVIGPGAAANLQARWDVRWGLRCAPNAPTPEPDKIPSGPIRVGKFSDVDGAAAAIVSAGYRELAKRFHPDAGGDHNTMSLLTQAHKQLKQILDMAKGGPS